MEHLEKSTQAKSTKAHLLYVEKVTGQQAKGWENYYIEKDRIPIIRKLGNGQHKISFGGRNYSMGAKVKEIKRIKYCCICGEIISKSKYCDRCRELITLERIRLQKLLYSMAIENVKGRINYEQGPDDKRATSTEG